MMTRKNKMVFYILYIGFVKAFHSYYKQVHRESMYKFGNPFMQSMLPHAFKSSMKGHKRFWLI